MGTAPFDDIRALIGGLPTGDDAAGARAREAARGETAFGGAGPLAEIGAWLATWTAKSQPKADRATVAVFVAAHGIARHGVSAETSETARSHVEALSSGEGLLPRLCAEASLGLKVLDLALDLPTGDSTREAALDERGCAATMAFGMEAVAGGHDVLFLTGLGVGGRTSAAAVLAAMFRDKAEIWSPDGRGEQHLRLRQIAAIDSALARHRGQFDEPLHVLRCLGGRETAAIAGAIVAARMERIPVVLDGLAALSAAAVLHRINPEAILHCTLASRPRFARAAEVARIIGLDSLETFDFAEGEGAPGIAGALAIPVLRAAASACAPRIFLPGAAARH